MFGIFTLIHFEADQAQFLSLTNGWMALLITTAVP